MASKASSLALRRFILHRQLPAAVLSMTRIPTVAECQPRITSNAWFSTSLSRFKEEATNVEENEANEEITEEDKESDWLANYTGDPKDRSREIPVETSMEYLKSDGYRQTYGDKKVWELYRRNFAKGRTWVQTRKTCIRQGKLATGNPCPICRDEYLVVDYRNLALIHQFIDEYSGLIYSSKKTGVCQHQYKKILIAIDTARDKGILTIDPPHIEYDYSKYMPKE